MSEVPLYGGELLMFRTLLPALRAGANRLFQCPWFVLDLAGIRRPVVQMRGLKKEGLLPPYGHVVVAQCVLVSS